MRLLATTATLILTHFLDWVSILALLLWELPHQYHVLLRASLHSGTIIFIVWTTTQVTIVTPLSCAGSCGSLKAHHLRLKECWLDV